ncbi:uncharacterized protein LOC114673506 isoform X4 [Macaca mulatta]
MRPAAAAPARPAPTPALAPARQPCPLTPRPGPLRPWGQRAEVRGRGEEPLLLPPPGAQARGAAGKGLGTGGTRSLGQARPAAACPELRKLVVPLSGSSPTGAPAADQCTKPGRGVHGSAQGSGSVALVPPQPEDHTCPWISQPLQERALDSIVNKTGARCFPCFLSEKVLVSDDSNLHADYMPAGS